MLTKLLQTKCTRRPFFHFRQTICCFVFVNIFDWQFDGAAFIWASYIDSTQNFGKYLIQRLKRRKRATLKTFKIFRLNIDASDAAKRTPAWALSQRQG
jgi:hypothetical protein